MTDLKPRPFCGSRDGKGGSDDRIGDRQTRPVPRMRVKGPHKGLRKHPEGSDVLHRVPPMRIYRRGTRSRTRNRQVE